MTHTTARRHPFLHRRAFAQGAACLVTALVGCDSDDPGGDAGGDDTALDERTHVGVADGTDVVLAAIVEASSVTMYICGGPQTVSTHTRWFRGMPLGGDGAFSAVDGDWSLSGFAEPGVVNGTLTEPDGTVRTFSAAAVRTASSAGLYAAVVEGCETGVVVQETTANDDYITQGAWCSTQSEFEQVIILTPLAFTTQGIEVRVDRGDPPMQFFVTAF